SLGAVAGTHGRSGSPAGAGGLRSRRRGPAEGDELRGVPADMGRGAPDDAGGRRAVRARRYGRAGGRRGDMRPYDGFNAYVFVADAHAGDLERLRGIKRRSGVRAVAPVVGAFDAVVALAVDSLEELQRVVLEE